MSVSGPLGHGSPAPTQPKNNSDRAVLSLFKSLAITFHTHRHNQQFSRLRQRRRGNVEVIKLGRSRFASNVCSITRTANSAALSTCECSSYSNETAKLVIPKNAPSIAAATVPEYSTLMPAFRPPLMPLTTRSGLLDKTQTRLASPSRPGLPSTCPAAAARTVVNLLGRKRSEERDRVTHAALLLRRSDDRHITQPSEHPTPSPPAPERICRRQFVNRICTRVNGLESRLGTSVTLRPMIVEPRRAASTHRLKPYPTMK